MGIPSNQLEANLLMAGLLQPQVEVNSPKALLMLRHSSALVSRMKLPVCPTVANPLTQDISRRIVVTIQYTTALTSVSAS